MSTCVTAIFTNYRQKILTVMILLLPGIIEGKMLGKARGRKMMELLHNMMEGRDYRQLKDLISDRSRWRQDSK